MRYLPLVLVFAAAGAHAQFKCVGPDGSVSLQQAPCATGQRAERLELPPPEPLRPEHIRVAIAQGRVVTGMTRAEVDRAAGRKPLRSTTSTYADGQDQQLIYRVNGKRLYVYLRDGVVTSYSGEDD